MIIEDESILRTPCELVESEAEAKQIIAALDRELEASAEAGCEGIGLAAVQINIPKQVFIIRLGRIKYDFVNPKIISLKNPVVVAKEGCLSYKDKFVRTLRYYDIIVDGAVGHDEPIKVNDWIAVAIQHEMAHLMGKTMFDNELSKILPTSLCLCGSEKIYKKCCYAALKKNMRVIG